MGRGAKTNKSEVDKPSCRQDDGRHSDQDINRATQIAVREVEHPRAHFVIKPGGPRTAWRKGCRVRARAGREMCCSTEAKTYHGE